MNGFLFDENVPSRLQFIPKLPSIPLSKVGRNPTDTQIWNYSRAHDLVIVTKDADFSVRIIASTPPPRVVHLRFGNVPRRDFHSLLARKWNEIESVLKTKKLVNVYFDRIEGIG